MFFRGPMTSSADSRMTEHSDSQWLVCNFVNAVNMLVFLLLHIRSSYNFSVRVLI